MLELLEKAELLAPTEPFLQRALASAYLLAGRGVEARAAECAAIALETRTPMKLFDLGTSFFLQGQNEAAAKWYRVALMLDPHIAMLHQNLACVLELRGSIEEAQAHRERAYRQQCVYVETASAERRRVLILAASGRGNVPIEPLLPIEENTRIKWFVGYARPGSAASLPSYDLVFNAIGDPDVEKPARLKSRNFLRCCARPVLNPPDRIARTRRDRLRSSLRGICGVHVPPVARVRNIGQATAVTARRGVAFPLLLRPAGSHGGDGLVRLDTQADLQAVPFDKALAWYLSPFRNYQSPDGYWRKYRIIFVDRIPYPYHLAISDHWLVHYVTANMLSDGSKAAEERRFLEHPTAALGEPAMTALREIGARLDLDYAGVDFSLLSDGQLLVFEANATMLVRTENLPALAFKNPFVAKILTAFEDLLARRQMGKVVCDVGKRDFHRYCGDGID